MSRNEDRELQIKIAELQADVQINLAACFGFLAVFVTIMIGFEQIYFSLPPDASIVRVYIVVSIIIAAFVTLFVASYFFRKAMRARDQIKELKKQYVW